MSKITISYKPTDPLEKFKEQAIADGLKIRGSGTVGNSKHLIFDSEDDAQISSKIDTTLAKLSPSDISQLIKTVK